MGFFEKEDLEKNIFEEFTKISYPHPENSFLEAYAEGEQMPEEAERGFKFNGSWQPAM